MVSEAAPVSYLPVGVERCKHGPSYRAEAGLLATARLQVRVGSLGDPDDLPGLAHFTEHMLFYASEKYPQEDEYSKFVVSMHWSTTSMACTHSP